MIHAPAFPVSPTPKEEHEAQARMLLGAANIVGGLWRTTADRNNLRGLELIAWVVCIMKDAEEEAEHGAPPTTGTESPAPLLGHLAD